MQLHVLWPLALLQLVELKVNWWQAKRGRYLLFFCCLARFTASVRYCVGWEFYHPNIKQATYIVQAGADASALVVHCSALLPRHRSGVILHLFVVCLMKQLLVRGSSSGNTYVIQPAYISRESFLTVPYSVSGVRRLPTGSGISCHLEENDVPLGKQA